MWVSIKASNVKNFPSDVKKVRVVSRHPREEEED